ncbi:class I SAM-dependent methyltransferase [Flavobacteriaceae bacterium]|nr:class I SAM-dependent methyltransferase [Flavobacteriaceae bacterium]
MKLFDNINLVCPACRNSLDTTSKYLLICNNNDCKQHGQVEYLDNQKPVLINFEKSIFLKTDLLNSGGRSKLKRNLLNYLPFKFIKRILNGSNNKTKINFSKIIKKLSSNSDPKILIIGGGSVGVGVDLFYNKFKNNIVSFDVYDTDYVDFIGDANHTPFEDNSFDFVLIQAVLEHVENPNKVVSEIYRILNDQGLVYAETPFLQHVHEGAYDFTRYTVLGHRMLFKKFEKIDIGYIGGLGQSLLWSIEFYTKSLFRSKLAGKLFKLMFFWLRLLEAIIPDSYNDDGACGSFFYGIKDLNNPKKPLNKYLDDYQGNQ